MISFFSFFHVLEHQWNEIEGITEVLGGKTCPSAIFSTTNHTWMDPGSNQGLHDDRLVTRHLSNGMAH
jgi:hypothetical protein